MAQSDFKSLSEVKEIVKKWWSTLQYERKCNSTNTVYKIVSQSSEEIQQLVKELISQEIMKVIEECVKSKDVNDMQNTCNAINGCFDNFIHAVEAVRDLFAEVIQFIDFGLSECQFKLFLINNPKNSVLELLHSFSRILILVLKLKRTQNPKNEKNNFQKIKHCNVVSSYIKENVQNLLCTITEKIGQFLIMDEVLIDTKNNLSMSSILIREILNPEEIKLKEFHKKFVNTIPLTLSEENFKLNILKFLTCSAVINTWSVNIIDSDSTYSYLKFFISLCENYSSETPVILNTSRTLLLLIKHDSFKEFVHNSDKEQVQQIISTLLSCIFMLLEYPVACVRHSAKDFLPLLAATPLLQPVIVDSVFKLPTDKRCFFISIGALANEIGSRNLIESNKELPKQLFSALGDPTIITHVSSALEFMILKDPLAEKNFSEWCETWIVPLLISLMNVLPIVAADIDKLLGKAFKKYPNSVIYVTNKWAHPSSAEELRYIITALKISHKQGLKLKARCLSNESINKNENSLESEKKLIDEALLQHCLHHRDDDIRISTFSLLIEAHKSTKPYSEKDFKLINYFLKYNLNNQQPATRQKILGLVRKMLVRFSDSKATFLKASKSNDMEQNSKKCLMYDNFLNSFVEFCFNNIFVGCNFNRLNSVLNFLLLCFENIKDMCFVDKNTNYYWNKFLIALDSSYEENKELAVTLSRKLNMSILEANKPEAAKLLYEKAFSLCTHMEPPDVLTGSYLLQTLMHLPSSKEVLSRYFVKDFDHAIYDVNYYCVYILTQKLKEQLQLACLDLMTAATCGPMYGTLFAIRLIFKSVNFPDEDGNFDLKKYWTCWSKILNELVEISFEITHIVGCVVNSSSPEGHLPMDFQTDLENLLPLNFAEECKIEDGTENFSAINNKTNQNETFNLLKIISDTFLSKFHILETAIQSSHYDPYETLRSLKSLLKENQLIVRKAKIVNLKKSEFLNGENNSSEIKFLEEVEKAKNKIEKYIEKLEKNNAVIDWPATAQVLLLCAWRSIKEASLYLGELVSKLPIEKEISFELLTKDTIIKIGEELKILLCEIKHRGAFEHAYIGFSQLVNSLWKCSDKSLNNLPRKWLEEIICLLESPLKDQKMKFCSTRRSAGLPFLVQAIICSEIVSVKSSTPSSLHNAMKSLLKITENGVAENSESKIHALNIMRALFKHAQLGEHVASYVSRALMVAICGSRSASWSERNSSNLLFSSLIIRIFGVARSRDEISKKNRMTSRTFFQRYSELYDFLLLEMDLVCSKENCVNGVYPKPSLYLVLLILGRLYPPPTEDPENIDLSEFLPYINMSRRNPIMKIRELGARALVSLISLDKLLDELDNRFCMLNPNSNIIENERHGILLQIKALLTESVETLDKLIKESRDSSKIKWIDNTGWMLQQSPKCRKQVSFISLSTYIKVLHILFKNCSSLRNEISELILNASAIEDFLLLSFNEKSVLPGIYLFFENFYFLKTDILGCQWLSFSDYKIREQFFQLFLFLLNCKISEIQSIPFRILCFVLSDCETNLEDDDFTGMAESVSSLLIFQSRKNIREFREKIFSCSEIKKFLVEHLNKDNQEYFKSKFIHRVWLKTLSILVMNDEISISHSFDEESDYFLKIDFAKPLLKSGDKSISTNALILYAIYLMEKVLLKEKTKSKAQDRFDLFCILNEFSSPDADVKEKIAVAKILNRCSNSLMEKNLIDDPLIMSIWMIPLKLLVDEDSSVRIEAAELILKMQEFILQKKSPEELIIKMNTLDWPHLSLVFLKAQECLLDSFVNILGKENLLYLIVQMIIMAMSSLCDPNNFSKDEFGVFEKGNPNPFCEELSLSDLMCVKLTELASVIDLQTLMRANLDHSLAKFIAESFHWLEFFPETLMEVVEKISTVVKDSEKLNKEFSLSFVQMRNLRRSLGLQEIIIK